MSQQTLTKSQYIMWVQECCGSDCSSIEDLGDGLAYCKILSIMYPAMININEATVTMSRSDIAATTNWQLIQKCFRELNIQKKLDVGGLVSRKTDPNLDFAQWFYTAFSARMKVIKCCEAAKNVRVLKEIEAENALKLFEEESRKEQQLLKIQADAEADVIATQDLFATEEAKAKDAEDAMKVAIDVAGSIKDIVQQSLDEEVRLAAENTKFGLYGGESDIPKAIGKKSDSVNSAIEETVSAREYAISAIKALAEAHHIAVKASKTAKAKVVDATVNAKEQTERTQKLKKVLEMKDIECKKAEDAVKHAKFALAVLDAYENADVNLQTRVHKDAVTALKRVEDCLDAFDVVKHTPSNLRVYSGGEF